MTEEQFDKLPRYARDEIEHLRRQVVERDDRIAELTGAKPAIGFVGSSASFSRVGSQIPAKPILFDRYDTVRIALTGELDETGNLADKGQEYLEIRREVEGRVYVRASSGQIAFLSEVSNTGYLTTATTLTDEGRMTS